MTKSDLSLNQLSIFLLITIFCTVWSLPASSEVNLEHQHESKEEVIGIEEKTIDDDQPIYEFQLAVWPDEYLSNVHSTVQNTGDNVYTPQFEVQEVVLPVLTDTEDGATQVVATIPTWQNSQTTKKPSTLQNDFENDIPDHEDVDHSLIGGVQPDDSVTQKPDVSKPHVEVVEQYQIVHPNGTTEYKLVLSNGMTNYKKIYNKLMPDGKVITVQEGYDSVPIPGDDPYSNDFQTQFYIADEHGHNVYKVEKHTRQPELPQYLDYKLQLGTF